MPFTLQRSLEPQKFKLPPWWWRGRRCRPRILIVTDGLNYVESDGFGLTRFIDSIVHHPSATLRPRVTLAHRFGHISPVTISGTSYDVKTSFNFDTATPAVTRQNYDQVWLFGISSSPITDDEVDRLAQFMNAGGGVFSTGDHAALGSGMSARLPRIRHMRNWSSIPMGYETVPASLERIDTVVDPGADNQYEFVDQSDDVPQRIYPNYKVTGSGPNDWVATIHPVLRMPGTAISRSPANSGFGPSAFSNDIDVLPDHPHESECFEVSTSENSAALNGTYNEANQNFPEFPNKQVGGGKIPSEIVAFSVSGGRAIHSGPSKPPVRPRMFGANSAFDGHLAAPISGSGRPGRIMCDATWHHFVNINLDGVGTSRDGLGSWNIGNTIFTPSADLLKIYKYFQNMVSWLQPSNRVWCWFYIYISEVYYRSPMREEFLDVIKPKDPTAIRKLGIITANAIDEMSGAGTSQMMVQAALRESEDGEKLADLLDPHKDGLMKLDISEVIAKVMGQAAMDLIPNLPDAGELKIVDDKKALAETDKSDDKLHERFESSLRKGLKDRVVDTLEERMDQTEKERRRRVKAFKTLKEK